METQNNNFNQEQNKNMQPCASCGNMVSKNAKSCPNCGAKIKKPIYKRVWFILLMVVVAVVIIAVAAGGGNSDTSGESGTTAPAGSVASEEKKDSELGDYKVEIKSCKLDKDYNGDPVAVVTYAFTNNAKESAAFDLTFVDHAYQNGVEAEHVYFLMDESFDKNNNQSKEIKPGVTIDVQVAYKLNDTSSAIDVEVGLMWSFDDSKVTKTFNF